MNRAALSQRISSILDDIQRLNNALYAMNTTDIQRYPDNYETLSTDAALRAETIACRLRHILYATTNVRKEDYLTSAALMTGIDIQYNDGIMEITLPSLLPTIITLTLMAIGKIFYSDFGLFYQVPMDSGPLLDVTSTIDTYVYRGLIRLNDIGMSSAAGFYQSVVGFVLVLLANWAVRKVGGEENALF